MSRSGQVNTTCPFFPFDVSGPAAGISDGAEIVGFLVQAGETFVAGIRSVEEDVVAVVFPWCAVDGGIVVGVGGGWRDVEACEWEVSETKRG